MALISDWKIRCLICLKDVPARIPVFGSHGQRKNIRRMMAEFLNVTVRQSDSDPNKICESCYDTLQKVNDLKGCAQESKRNLKLLRNFHEQEQEDRRAEDIRLWIGSQRTEQGEMSVLDEHDLSDQQQHSDFMYSSISANEATSSIGLNMSAVVSENSDAVDNRHRVSLNATHQQKSQQGGHHKGKKRAGTPLPFSAPSSRSCSPQPGALPPESSRKQYRSAARSQLKTHSKTAVQQNRVDGLPEKNVDHSGSPQLGSLPPETAGKSSATQKPSKNLPVNSESATLQSEGSNPVSQESGLITKPVEKVQVHRAQSCSPLRGNSQSVSVSTPAGHKRRRGRPRSRSVPPSKHRKMFDQAEPQDKSPNETASKATPWKPRLDDDLCFGRITTSCDLKEFKKHIPFVKLQRLEDHNLNVQWPGLLPLRVSTEQDFILVQDDPQGILQQFCWICNKTFPSNENMQQHLIKHTANIQAGCSSSKDETEPSSKGETPFVFVCKLCQVPFTSNGFLQRHMMYHAEKKWSHKCTVCEETFQTSAILKRHMGNHNISCDICGAVFTITEDLKRHRKCHQQQQVYICSCCLQEFTSEQALGKHVAQHRKCTLCSKTFTGKDELATHVGESHKVCSICDETLADEEELQSHIETSHEKCNLCGEQFLFEEELSAHLKKHPYQCVMCLSAFNDKAQRMEHMKQSHQDMMQLLKETVAKEKITI